MRKCKKYCKMKKYVTSYKKNQNASLNLASPTVYIHLF